MKKIALILFVALILSGCINGKDVTTTTTVSTTVETTVITIPTTTTTTLAPPKTPSVTSAPVDMPETGVVTAAWLKDHLDDVLMVYVGKTTKDRSNYEIAHIPGSVYLGARELCRPAEFTYLGVDRETNCCVFGDSNELCQQAPLNGGFDYQVATKAQFEQLAGSIGVTNNKPVVIYGNPKDPYVARAFWDFAYYGQKVYYLDGGIRAWKYGTTMNKTKIIPTQYIAASPDTSLRATADYVYSKLDDPNTAIVEVRTMKEHTGELIYSNNMRGGHIPGSIRIDWPGTLNRDGTFKSKAALKKMYESQGVTPDKEVITYCEGGVRASHTLLVLKYILGYPNVRNFEASWNEWGNAKDADGTYKYPIEK